MQLTPEQLNALRSVPLGDMPNRVRQARLMLDLKQHELGAALGLVNSQVSDIERGEYKSIDLERSRAIAEFFGCAIEDLFPARQAVA